MRKQDFNDKQRGFLRGMLGSTTTEGGYVDGIGRVTEHHKSAVHDSVAPLCFGCRYF